MDIEKYNFKINLDKKNISISVVPKIFPLSVIMNTAYQFMDQADVVVTGDPSENVIVELIFKRDNVSKSELEKIGYQFNNGLINSFLEDLRARRCANIRNFMVSTALTPIKRIKEQQRV